MNEIGLMIGHFEPFHLGDVRNVLHACGQVKQLYIFITPNPNPNPNFPVTLQDKARWLTMAFADLPFIKINILSDIFVENSILSNHEFDKNTQILQKICASFPEKPILFLPYASPLQKYHVNLSMEVLPNQSFDRNKIANNPALHWTAIHPLARPSYTKTLAIVGGESSGKTTLLHKLVNYYGASYALEMGRLYVQTDLGGTELGLQYSDYPLIANSHIQAIHQAKQQATAPVTLIDTDFVTTQAFCEEYEGKAHPFLTACIHSFKMDYTMMLANNTKWVADGMRSLGSTEQRQRFANRLQSIYQQHDIQPILIDNADYHQRFLQAVAFIDKHIFNNYQE